MAAYWPQRFGVTKPSATGPSKPQQAGDTTPTSSAEPQAQLAADGVDKSDDEFVNSMLPFHPLLLSDSYPVYTSTNLSMVLPAFFVFGDLPNGDERAGTSDLTRRRS